jgi:hypothetical protein
MQNFKTVAYLLLGYFWLMEDYDEEELLIIKASLATAEVLGLWLRQTNMKLCLVGFTEEVGGCLPFKLNK